MPFHAAEQQSEERNSGSAEYPAGGGINTPKGVRLSETPSLCEQRREAVGQVNGCPFFWFVFLGQAKKMNIYSRARKTNDTTRILAKKTILFVVNSLVGQLIGPAVLLAPHVGYAERGKPGEPLHGFLIKRLQIRVFNLVFPANLFDYKF